MPDGCYFAIAGNVFRDVVKCFYAGSHRAALQMLWISIAGDLVWRVEQLASEGDAKAKAVEEQMRKISEDIKNGAPDAIRKAQNFEAAIPETLFQLEQISSYERELFNRLKRDRNLAAHMPLDWHFDAFDLTEDLVRAHIRTAFDRLLSKPPVAGKSVADAVLGAIREKSFPKNTYQAGKILQGIWHDRPTPSLVRTLTDRLVFDDSLRIENPEGALTLARVLDSVEKKEFSQRLADRFSKYGPKQTDEIVAWLCRLVFVDMDAYDLLDDPARERIAALYNSGREGLVEHTIEQILKSPDHQFLLRNLIRRAPVSELAGLFYIYDSKPLLDLGVQRIKQSRTWNDTNAIYDGMIAGSMNHVTVEQAVDIAEAAFQGSDFLGSHGFSDFIAKSFQYLSLDDRQTLTAKLNELGLERYVPADLRAVEANLES